MSKIMQVINKKSNFQNGIVDLQLYQTGFASLTKLIDTAPGQTVENAVANQKLGFEFFHDLNNKQLAVRDYVDKFKVAYNSEINKKKGKVANLINFNYNWKSCVDYKSQIKAGDRADYRLLTKIVAAEKELHDYTVYSKQHLKKNCEILGDWGKDKNYMSNFINASFHWDAAGNWTPDRITFITEGQPPQLIPFHGNGDDGYYVITKEMLEKIVVGGSARVYVSKYLKYEFYVHVLDNDKYFAWRFVEDYYHVHRIWTTYNRTGQVPSHFIDLTGKYNLNFFKTRVLI